MDLIGSSKATSKLRETIRRLSSKPTHVIITGERGVGKTTIARLIHESSVAKGSMITLNPSTASDAGIKSTLAKISPGVSTLLIQNIEDFSFVHQALIQKALLPLKAKPSVRVIITCGSTINELGRGGYLFEDLYDILKSYNVIDVPRLSDRTEDIPLLVEHFIKNACDMMGSRVKVIDINTLDILMRKDWRENITELRSLVEMAVFSSKSEIVELSERIVDEETQVKCIVERISENKAFSFDKSLSNLEKTFIERALGVAGYNQTKAAGLFGISEANFRYRLKKFNILSVRKK